MHIGFVNRRAERNSLARLQLISALVLIAAYALGKGEASERNRQADPVVGVMV